jgi:hypothetical protein
MKYILLAASLVLAFIAPAHAADRSNTIAVSGHARIEVPAQFATITLGVATQDPSIAQASAQNAASMRAVVDALRRIGIAANDVQTSSFTIVPRYERHPTAIYEGEALRPIVGFSVSNTVWVKVRNTADVARVIDVSTAAGANTISSIGFGLEPDETLVDRARREAVADARHTAGVLAAAENLEIVRAVSITESGTANPYLNVASADDVIISGSRAPSVETLIMARRIHVEARVTVMYAVK